MEKGPTAGVLFLLFYIVSHISGLQDQGLYKPHLIIPAVQYGDHLFVMFRIQL